MAGDSGENVGEGTYNNWVLGKETICFVSSPHKRFYYVFFFVISVHHPWKYSHLNTSSYFILSSDLNAIFSTSDLNAIFRTMYLF